MSYLPRPDAERTAQDVDEIYALAAEELQRASSAADRRRAFRLALLRAYEAGVDAQREVLSNYVHDRPTSIPAAPEAGPGGLGVYRESRADAPTVEVVADLDDPGILPPGRRVQTDSPQPFPLGVAHPHEPKKR